jgi:hypothetical protein
VHEADNKAGEHQQSLTCQKTLHAASLARMGAVLDFVLGYLLRQEWMKE